MLSLTDRATRRLFGPRLLTDSTFHQRVLSACPHSLADNSTRIRIVSARCVSALIPHKVASVSQYHCSKKLWDSFLSDKTPHYPGLRSPILEASRLLRLWSVPPDTFKDWQPICPQQRLFLILKVQRLATSEPSAAKWIKSLFHKETCRVPSLVSSR